MDEEEDYSETCSVDSVLDKAVRRLWERFDEVMSEFQSEEQQRSEADSEASEDMMNDETIPFDLVLFGAEDLKSMHQRFLREFYIFCSEELAVIRELMIEYRKINLTYE